MSLSKKKMPPPGPNSLPVMPSWKEQQQQQQPHLLRTGLSLKTVTKPCLLTLILGFSQIAHLATKSHSDG